MNYVVDVLFLRCVSSLCTVVVLDIYIYIYIHICVYIYIYIYRERERYTHAVHAICLKTNRALALEGVTGADYSRVGRLSYGLVWVSGC